MEVVWMVVGLLVGAVIGCRVGKIVWMKRPLWVCVSHVSRDGVVCLAWQDIRPHIKQGAQYMVYRKEDGRLFPKRLAVVSKPEFQDGPIQLNRMYWYCVVGDTALARSVWLGSFSSWMPVVRRSKS